jgi:hypothetical protein
MAHLLRLTHLTAGRSRTAAVPRDCVSGGVAKDLLQTRAGELLRSHDVEYCLRASLCASSSGAGSLRSNRPADEDTLPLH